MFGRYLMATVRSCTELWTSSHLRVRSGRSQPSPSCPIADRGHKESYDVTSYSDDAFTVNGEVDPAKIPAFLPRKQAATGRPKPVNVAYIRTDDHADMIEIGPHQSASLDA